MTTAVQVVAAAAGLISFVVLVFVVIFIVWLDTSKFDPNNPWN